MSETIVRNPEWLREQIEAGIQGYLEAESDRIIESIRGHIMNQIRDIMYLEHSESEAMGGATVNISFEIPDSAECARGIGTLEPENPSD